MSESVRDRAKRYDAMGWAAVTYGPLAGAIVAVGQWLISLVTQGGYVDVESVVFLGALVCLSLVWVFFRLRQKRLDS
jgi:hypothetical protein